jgi:hypothetical protein
MDPMGKANRVTLCFYFFAIAPGCMQTKPPSGGSGDADRLQLEWKQAGSAL